MKDFKTIFEKACPKRKKSSNKKRKNKPWMTQGLKNACKKKNNLYANFLKSQSSISENRYKTYKNKLLKILKRAEKDHYAKKLEQHKNNAKISWKILNEVLNRKPKPQPKPGVFYKNNEYVKGNKAIANAFNDFFANIGPNLAKTIPNSEKHYSKFLQDNLEKSIFLSPTSCHEIVEIANTLKAKVSLDKDDLNMNIVKHVISTIAEPISHICNVFSVRSVSR